MDNDGEDIYAHDHTPDRVAGEHAEDERHSDPSEERIVALCPVTGADGRRGESDTVQYHTSEYRSCEESRNEKRCRDELRDDDCRNDSGSNTSPVSVT